MRPPPPACGGARRGSARARVGSAGGGGARCGARRRTRESGPSEGAAEATRGCRSTAPRAAPARRSVRRHEARQPHAPREVEPDDRVRRLEHEVAELPSVRAVDHPRVARDERLDAAAQLGRVELGPAGLPVDRVELDERHAQPGGERPAEGRLAASAGRGDDRNASHERQFVARDGSRALYVGSRAVRLVYAFDEEAPGGRELLGGKGVGLAEMTALGIPVPAGFTVTTDACRETMRTGEVAGGALAGDGRARRAARRSAPGSASAIPATRSSCRSARARRSRCRG